MTDPVLARPERFFSDRFNVTPSLMERVLGGALKGRVDTFVPLGTRTFTRD